MGLKILMLYLLVIVLRVEAMGVNWGTVSSHRLPNYEVVKMLQTNRISKVKLFDADLSVVRSFQGTEVELMVAIPNDLLSTMALSSAAARRWVKYNVTKHLKHPPVNIKYIAVGNEPFLKAYNGTYQNVTIPALKNIQEALREFKLQDKVKAVVPLNADVLSNGNSILPSAGRFREDIQTTMRDLVDNLNIHSSPFIVNIYPFLSLQEDPNFPKEFAFFDDDPPNPIIDGDLIYKNAFDASYDLLVSALSRDGYPNMPIIVGEVGWPTDGDVNANLINAQKFNQELLKHAYGGKGTPLRPGVIEIYLFGLIDEDDKSVLPGNFERHWGIYAYDGKPKYHLDVSGRGVYGDLSSAEEVTYLPSRWCIFNPHAQDMSWFIDSVNYACSRGDCTCLMYGGSCNNIGEEGNVSYAFNSYYQMNNQDPQACDFNGLGMVTEKDPSSGNCKFRVQIIPNSSSCLLPIYFILIILLILHL